MKIKTLIEILFLTIIVILISSLINKVSNINDNVEEIAWVLNGAEIEFVNENNLEK